MATKLWQGNGNEGLSSIKSHYTLITWSCEITWQTKTIYISTTKLSWGAPNHKVYIALITLWSCKVTWQTKTIISLHQKVPGHQTWQELKSPWQDADLYFWVPLIKLLDSVGHVVWWDYLTDKLKPLYLYYHSTYCHQICQVIDLT